MVVPYTSSPTPKGLTRYLDYDQAADLARYAAALDPVAAPALASCNKEIVRASLQTPETSLHGFEKYPTLHEKAAALMYAIVKNHGCPNGNKKLAVVLTLGFLQENDVFLWVTNQDLKNRVLDVDSSPASDADFVRAQLATWIYASTIPLMQANLMIQAGKRP